MPPHLRECELVLGWQASYLAPYIVHLTERLPCEICLPQGVHTRRGLRYPAVDMSPKPQRC